MEKFYVDETAVEVRFESETVLHAISVDEAARICCELNAVINKAKEENHVQD